MNPNPTARQSGFSLVEVTLALGVVAFCLVALVGLLPAGLGTVREASDEAAAINCLEQISSAIRRAQRLTVSGSVTYRAAGAYQEELEWQPDGKKTEFTLDNLSASGFPADEPIHRRYTAHIEIIHPADPATPGRARISVAWPERAQWDGETGDWRQAQGRLHSWLLFLPKN